MFIFLIHRYQYAINSLIDMMSGLNEVEKTKLQSTLHMYLEEANAVKSVMNGELKEEDLKQDFKQKTDSYVPKDRNTDSLNLSEIGSDFMSAINDVGRNVLPFFVLTLSSESLTSVIRW